MSHADVVTEVLRISEASVAATSTVNTTQDSFYIDGIAKLEDRLLILLNIERALADRGEELLGA